MDTEQGGTEVQPDSGQDPSTDNAGSNLDEFYDMSSVPAEQRQYVDPILQEIQGNVNKKIEQLNGKYSPYQPLMELELHENPELIEDLSAIARIAGDEEALQEWWQGLGQERGWVDEGEDDEYDDDPNSFDDDDDQLTDEDIANFRSAIEEVIEQRTAPLYELEAEREQQEAIADANKTIDSQLKELHDKHGEFNDQAVCKLALGYDSEDAIELGFKDYQELINSAQNGVFESRSDAPPAPEGAGSADTSAPRITDFKDAKAAAIERMKQANQS